MTLGFASRGTRMSPAEAARLHFVLRFSFGTTAAFITCEFMGWQPSALAPVLTAVLLANLPVSPPLKVGLVLVIVMARFRGSVKKATQEVRRRESEVMSVAQEGLESVRTVQALGAQQVEGARLAAASRATVTAAVHARLVKSLLSPTVSVVVAEIQV